MQIIKIPKRQGGGQMIKVDEDEALRLIASLSNQMRRKSPNIEREEFYTDKGEYFSIAVTPTPKEFDKHGELKEILKSWKNKK